MHNFYFENNGPIEKFLEISKDFSHNRCIEKPSKWIFLIFCIFRLKSSLMSKRLSNFHFEIFDFTSTFPDSHTTLHQIRRYPAPYISKAGQKATPSNILQPFIPHCFPLQSPYINSRPFISSPHYFYSSPIRFRICPTPAQPTSILTRIVFPADQQPILNDQFYVEEMPEEIVIVVKLIYSDRTHST